MRWTKLRTILLALGTSIVVLGRPAAADSAPQAKQPETPANGLIVPRAIVSFAHDPAVTAVAFTRDGKQLATAYQTTVTLWDPTGGKQIRAFEAATLPVHELTFSADGKVLAGVCVEEAVLDGGPGPRREAVYWQTDTGKAFARMPAASIAFFPDGQRVLIGHDTDVFVYRLDRNQKSFALREVAHLNPEWFIGGRLALSPDGKTVIGTGTDRFYIWELVQDKELRLLHMAAYPVGNLGAVRTDIRQRSLVSIQARILGFSPDGSQFIAELCHTQVRLLSRPKRISGEDGDKERVPRPQDRDKERFPRPQDDFPQEGRRMPRQFEEPDLESMAVQVTCMPAVYDVAAGKRRDVELGRYPLPHGIVAAAYSPDGRTIATTTFGGTSLWDAASGRWVGRIVMGQAFFAPDWSVLACPQLSWTESGKCTLHVCRLATRTQVQELQRQAGAWTPQERERLWADLADVDEVKAWQARSALLLAPEQALRFLAERLWSDGAPDPRIVRLIADLDSDDFATRERATKGLGRLGSTAYGALIGSLFARPSLEVRRRVEALLEKIERPAPPAEVPVETSRRAYRVSCLVEQMATPEAEALLTAMLQYGYWGPSAEGQMREVQRQMHERMVKR